MGGIVVCQNPAADALEASFNPPPAALPLVSVICAVYNQLDYTKGLVASLAQNAGCDYELILVDNGSTDGTERWAKEHSIRCHRWNANQGVPVAYNEGVKLARGEILAFFNNDMSVHPDGLKRLAEATYRRGMAAQSGGQWDSEGNYTGATMERQWSDNLEGYAMAFQREVWDRTGVWDTGFFPSYADDSDWCLRARLQGFDYTLVPGCVTHFGQATSRSMNLNATVRKHQQIIRERFLPLGLGQRILVIRYAAAGDILMTTPVLRALKREAPLARLHVYCNPGAGSVLAGNPHVDHRFDQPIDPKRYTRIIDLTNAYEGGQKRLTWEHPVRAYCARAGVEFDGGRYDLFIPDDLREWAAGKLP